MKQASSKSAQHGEDKTERSGRDPASATTQANGFQGHVWEDRGGGRAAASKASRIHPVQRHENPTAHHQRQLQLPGGRAPDRAANAGP